MRGAAATTVVHLVRHGEVHNPDGVLYGRLPGFGLSELGVRMAELTGEHLAGRDIVQVLSSPLERAQQTARPIAERLGLPVGTDERLIESENEFEGMVVGGPGGAITRPANWLLLVNPLLPSWGEGYSAIARRMLAVVGAARAAARGHETVLVSHQLPVWTLRRRLEGRVLFHDPRRRECSLASVTSVRYVGDDPVELTYTEPAASLLPMARPGAGA
jgi:broad specificity phosphatase PhoE